MNYVKIYKDVTMKSYRDIAEDLKAIEPKIDAALVCKMAKGICEPSQAVNEWLKSTVAMPTGERKSGCEVITPLEDKDLLNGRFEEWMYDLIKLGTKEHPTSYTAILSVSSNLDRRKVRKCIENMRKNGIRICSKNGGFYLPKNDEEYLEFERRYLAAAYTKLKNAEAMRKTPVGNLTFERSDAGGI